MEGWLMKRLVLLATLALLPALLGSSRAEAQSTELLLFIWSNYTAPDLWGSTGIAYDTALVKGGKLEDSWKELFEPRPELVGKIGMMNDIGETFTAAAHYLGIDTCTEKPEDGQKILDLLTKQKPAV